MKTIALLVAAGSGNRVGGNLPKQYARLAGKPLLAHALDHLRHDLIDEVQVVIGPGQEALYTNAIGGRTLPPPIIGGSTRQQSVRNGLEALAERGDVGIVLIHDAARPFLPGHIIEQLVGALKQSDGAVPAMPVTDSLAIVGKMLGDPIDRDKVYKIQTPQVFIFDKILGAHRQWNGPEDAKDDAQVARAAGMNVAIVTGDHWLDKFTYAGDFLRAGQMLAASMTSRTSLGFDVHAFAENEYGLKPGENARPLLLGGLEIPHDRSLAGHSDADVVLHAITDALLGVISEGDIGEHFPPSDPQWCNAPSSRFVEFAHELIEARGGWIDHVDVTIICEEPKIGPHRLAIRENIGKLLGLHRGAISVKATTTEGLGFTGRGEGIAVQAVATVRIPEDL
jgi:2-C-methyl-D-erythritol 4-phosphate cytidylyltransferase/2-C-methyl-D-erythritol 2,4-cyclodiphosphate synthase